MEGCNTETGQRGVALRLYGHQHFSSLLLISQCEEMVKIPTDEREEGIF